MTHDLEHMQRIVRLINKTMRSEVYAVEIYIADQDYYLFRHNDRMIRFGEANMLTEFLMGFLTAAEEGGW